MYIGDEIRRRGLDSLHGSATYRSNGYLLKQSGRKISIQPADLQSDDVTDVTQQIQLMRDLNGTQAEAIISVSSPGTTDDHIWDAGSQSSQSSIVKTTTMTTSW